MRTAAPTEGYEPVSTELTAEPLDGGSGLRVADLVQKSLYILVGSLGIVGNGLVVVVIASGRKMRKRTPNVFILNQSCIDLVVSVVLVASVASTDRYELTGPSGAAICRLWLSQWLVWGTFMTSTYNLVALTLERFLGVVYPIWHKLVVTRRRAVVVAGIAWFVGPVYSLYQVVTARVIHGQCNILHAWSSKDAQKAFGVVTVFMEFIIPLITMVICYTRMAISLKIRVVPIATVASNVDVMNSKMMRAKRNVVKTLIMVCICFFLCWVWNEFFFLTFNLGIPVATFTGGFYHFTVMAVYVNCCINPFIYSFKYEEFKKRLRLLFRGTKVRDHMESMLNDSQNSAANPSSYTDNQGSMNRRQRTLIEA